jgi:hypothetical protein
MRRWLLVAALPGCAIKALNTDRSMMSESSSEVGQESVSPMTAASPLHAFEGDIRRPRTSFLYQIGLLVVAGAMVLLPIIYIGLIALATYGVYYHAVHHFQPIMDWGSDSRIGGRTGIYFWILKVFIYGGPLFIGAVVVFFMIKPLFAGRPARAQPYALNPGAEPLLFGFIERICRIVGAPMPRRIDLDCNFNAAAGYRRGWRSLFGQDLVLTIGLPLVAAFDMREFAGTLAHEFGHFTQGAAMRLSYIIRAIDLWFARVVYQRDAWDLHLEEWGQDADWRIAIVVGFARLGVWCSRQILKGLMLLGHGISCFMLRQMEFDADACEIKVAGSEAFESVARKFELMGAVLEKTYKEMRVSWNLNRRLPDNLPVFLANKSADLPASVRQRIEDTLGLQPTRLFDTHPSPADRIRRARRANEPGVFRLTEPAVDLFENFAVPARIVTLLHYQEDLRLPVLPASLVPVANRVGPAVVPAAPTVAPSPVEESEVAIQRYFFGLAEVMHPITLSPDDIAAPLNLNVAIQNLKSLPARLETVRTQVELARQRFGHSETRRVQAAQAKALLEAGLSIQPELFGLPEPTPFAAERALAEAQDEQARVREKLEPVTAELKTRLIQALALLRTPYVGLRLPNAGPLAREAAELVPVLSRLGDVMATLMELRRESAALSVLLRHREPGNAQPRLDAEIARTVARALVLQNVIEERTTGLPWPRSHSQGPDATVASASSGIRDPDAPARVVEEIQAFTQRLLACYHDVVGTLVRAAVEVEGSL